LPLEPYGALILHSASSLSWPICSHLINDKKFDGKEQRGCLYKELSQFDYKNYANYKYYYYYFFKQSVVSVSGMVTMGTRKLSANRPGTLR